MSLVSIGPMRALLVALVVAVLAAGCSGDDPPTPPDDAVTSTVPDPSDDASLFVPVPVPEAYDDLDRIFDRFVSVFGVSILATPGVAPEDLAHVARVTAELLDNDEDGVPDDIRVVDALVRTRATLVVASTPTELVERGFLAPTGGPGSPELTALVDFNALQTLAATELAVAGVADPALRAAHQLVLAMGWAQVHPIALGLTEGSPLADAMDAARGGTFPLPPDAYPDTAWFTDTNPSCPYRCQLLEYAYFLHTSLLGAQSPFCPVIAPVWKLCTADQVRAGDPVGVELFSNPELRLPTLLPDGAYRA